jgi:hypothetical protein
MTSPNQRKIIGLLTITLIIIVVVSVGLFLLLPGDSSPVTEAPQDTAPHEQATDRPTGFDVRVLQRSSYQALNTTLLQNGLLPVRPPANTGKANPFF